jgi:glycosyltransferase involved in cell wall biosynthesis
MPPPLVSVVLPVHNGERYLAQAIESALRQSVDPLELIVVDDASSDRSGEIVRGYGDRLVYHPVTKQASSIATTNVGLSLARGRYVCILHQDDYFLPGKLARQIELMDAHPNIGLSYSAEWLVGPAGEPLAPLRSPLRRGDYVVGGHVELWHLGVQNYLNYCNVVMRRSALEAVRGFDDPLWVSADWAVWLRLARRFQVGYIDDVLVCYRVHPEAQTLARTEDPDEWARQAWLIRDEYYDTPGLPPSLEARRALTTANMHLNIGLLRLMRGRWGGGVRSLVAVLRLSNWRLPALLYSAAFVPRAMARLRMLTHLRRMKAAGGLDAIAGGDVSLLRCPACGGISGYPLAMVNRRARLGAYRCIACQTLWDTDRESASSAAA